MSTETTILRFPESFLWGAATSAYQIEGSARSGGRGESIWDRFCIEPGRVTGGQTGDIACDHYTRWEQDMELMENLGLDSYRFSISWPRIYPEGSGKLNREGLDFYSRVVDDLLQKGITPAVTLYHWDLPQALQDQGGWPNRDTSYHFENYARTLFDSLGDRVKFWITLNEPWCAGMLGYFEGVHAPGETDMGRALVACHHMNLAHGRAVQALDGRGKVGISHALYPTYPSTPKDEKAARLCDGYTNRLFLDPILRGRYPEDILNHLLGVAGLKSADFIQEGDLKVCSAPIDFLGVNYYRRHVVREDASTKLGWTICPAETGRTVSHIGWEVAPEQLCQLLLRLERDYGPELPIYITENGIATDDRPGPNGVVDQQRIDFLADHIASAHQAIEQGVDLRGYFAWSLLDNFEWALGYEPRFGLTYVDYKTLERQPKASAKFYSGVIEQNGVKARQLVQT
jgi:beta-glucosidase